jgi:predicted nucleic acid-binding protein
MVFVDTGAWFARYVPSDPNHLRVTAWLDANAEPLLTTDYCIDETLTLLVARRRLRLALEVGRALIEENVAQLHFVSPDQIRRAWILFQQRAAAGWSFTDCTSKIVIDELGIATAIALDAHFQQFGIAIVP